MLNLIKKIFAPPIFEDVEKTRAAQYLNAVLYVGIVLLVFIINAREELFSTTNIVLGILTLTMVAMQILMRLGKVQLSAIILISITWVGMTYMAWEGDGIRNASLIVYIILIFLVSLLGNLRISILFTTLSIAAMWGLVYAEQNNIISPSLDTITNLARDLSVIYILIAVIIYLTTTNTNKALALSQKNEKKALQQTEKLLSLQNELENRVNERTIELETQATTLHMQAKQLKAIAETTQEIALIQNLETLLPQITTLISKHFDFYHVGIFLVNENKQTISLQASNSTEGKRILARNHQLKIGQGGIIEHVAQDGQARVALETGLGAVYFNNADLPETRSEMALPLKIGNKIIGVLDMQSKSEAFFSKEDLITFYSLAKQVSIAIESAHQTDITQAALKEARATSSQYVQQAWAKLITTQSQLEYSYTDTTLYTDTEQEEEHNIYTIPVKVHEEIIGHLKIYKGEGSLSSEQTELVKAVSNRVALALENARLLEDSQRRASKEQKIGEISNKIGASLRMDAIIQTTIRELGEAINGTEVGFRMIKPQKTQPPEKKQGNGYAK